MMPPEKLAAVNAATKKLSVEILQIEQNQPGSIEAYCRFLESNDDPNAPQVVRLVREMSHFFYARDGVIEGPTDQQLEVIVQKLWVDDPEFFDKFIKGLAASLELARV